MIDIENEVFTRVASALRQSFAGITVQGVTEYSPSKFPFVSIEEIDNYSLQRTRDSSGNENHAVLVYEINAYSNKIKGRKSECKAIISAADDIMLQLGFTRLTRNPVSINDVSAYRILARYTAVASQDKIIYRR